MKWKLLVASALIIAGFSLEAQAQFQPGQGIQITPGRPFNKPGPVVLPQIRPGFPTLPGTQPFPGSTLPGIVDPYNPRIGQPYYPQVDPRFNPRLDPRFDPRRNNRRGMSTKRLERYIESCLQAKFGRLIDDVDVDIDRDDLEAEIEVELRDIRYRRTVYSYIRSIPELRGYRLDIDIDD